MTTLFFLRSGVHPFRPDEPREAFFCGASPPVFLHSIGVVGRWTNPLVACPRCGGEVEPLRLGRSLKERLIARHERKVRMSHPAPLRSLFLNATGAVNFFRGSVPTENLIFTRVSRS